MRIYLLGSIKWRISWSRFPAGLWLYQRCHSYQRHWVLLSLVGPSRSQGIQSAQRPMGCCIDLKSRNGMIGLPQLPRSRIPRELYWGYDDPTRRSLVRHNCIRLNGNNTIVICSTVKGIYFVAEWIPLQWFSKLVEMLKFSIHEWFRISLVCRSMHASGCDPSLVKAITFRSIWQFEN